MTKGRVEISLATQEPQWCGTEHRWSGFSWGWASSPWWLRPCCFWLPRASSVVSASPAGARRKSTTHPQPKDLSSCPCAAGVWVIQDCSDKAPLNELTSSSLPNFGSASVSRLWTHLPTFGIRKGQALMCVFLCKENPDCVCGVSWGALGWWETNASSCYHSKASPVDCSTSSQVRGAWTNTRYNKCAANHDDTHTQWEARVCPGLIWPSQEAWGKPPVGGEE